MCATTRLMALIPTTAPVSDTDASTDQCVEAVQPDPTDSDVSEGIHFTYMSCMIV